MRRTVVVVEGDALLLDDLGRGLDREGFEVIRAGSLSKALLEIQRSTPNVILADYQFGDGTVFDLLAWLKTGDIRVPVVVLTGDTRIDLAVQAIKNGAEQFIPKPVDLAFLATTLRRTMEHFRFQQKDVANKFEQSRYVRDPFVGESQTIRELMKTARRASEANITILIQGETGTGKGVLARWLHRTSARASEAFVDLNCAGLSRELFESELFGYQKGAFTGAAGNKVGFLEAANHGTLFLDEIGDMDPQVQPKILKVVEERRFYRLGDVLERRTDVRIIAATHRDLKKLAEDGGFRSDLYFRISSLRLRIPPLRERLEDIPAITDKLLEQLSMDMKRGPLRISDNARLALQRYSWPGNIRELRNVLERAAILSDDEEIDQAGLEFDAPLRQGFTIEPEVQNQTLKGMERHHILQTLESEGGNIIRAAKRLGMPRSSLYLKIREHGLKDVAS
jgi:DNA-binding NtrC family response regulator